MKAPKNIGGNPKPKTLLSVKKKKLKAATTKNLTKKVILDKSCKKPKINNSPSIKQNKKSRIGKSKHEKKLQNDIEGLKDIDPEFYKFLKQNDKKLLEFNVLDSESEVDEDEDRQETVGNNEDEDNDDEEIENHNDEKLHRPTGSLEVASDESDFEDADEAVSSDGTVKITLNLLRQWQLQLEKPNVSVEVIRKVIQAFSSALASISGDEKERVNAPTPFNVVGAAVFNGVVQLCVLNLHSAILCFLKLPQNSTLPLYKTKKWVKVRGCLRYYLTDLIRLVEQVSSPNILSVLLKHLHQMAGMVALFTTLGKTILKRLIVIWSSGDETVRVLAFLCILKITRNQQISMLQHVLKAMYLSYVRNSKFVSPNTLPGINFMRRSLVEMFALDLNVSYQHAFLYIRQLAIHLRNAVVLKKKDSFQAVYNWQYINSIRLWVDLLGNTANKPQLQPLVYPLVTIITGVIRLIPTAQYFPLRFHCIQALITLSKETHTFIPVLPFILEVLRSNTFNRKHTAVSMRPQQFTCILRLNKAQLGENGFRDEVIEQVCGLTLEILTYESASLAFSDLVVPAVVSLKAYLKKCRNANYSRKLKQLLDKVQENSRFIEQERRKISFGLNDLSQVQAFETQVRNKGTPLTIYFESWVKTHETKKRRQAAQTDTINADYDVPTIKRKAKSGGVSVKNENGEIELFPSDSEDDFPEIPVGRLNDNDEQEEEVRSVQGKSKKDKKKKSKEKKENGKANLDNNGTLEEPAHSDNEVDIVKDLDLNDW